MDVYTKEQLDAIAIAVAQRIKESKALTTNQRTGLDEKYWSGTQAQYDALTTIDPNTRYWITS